MLDSCFRRQRFCSSRLAIPVRHPPEHACRAGCHRPCCASLNGLISQHHPGRQRRSHPGQGCGRGGGGLQNAPGEGRLGQALRPNGVGRCWLGTVWRTDLRRGTLVALAAEGGRGDPCRHGRIDRCGLRGRFCCLGRESRRAGGGQRLRVGRPGYSFGGRALGGNSQRLQRLNTCRKVVRQTLGDGLEGQGGVSRKKRSRFSSPRLGPRLHWATGLQHRRQHGLGGRQVGRRGWPLQLGAAWLRRGNRSGTPENPFGLGLGGRRKPGWRGSTGRPRCWSIFRRNGQRHGPGLRWESRGPGRLQ